MWCAWLSLIRCWKENWCGKELEGRMDGVLQGGDTPIDAVVRAATRLICES